MNDQFDELAKNLAQSVTRRGALKKFGVGVAGIVLAALGLANNVQARGFGCKCYVSGYGCDPQKSSYAYCLSYCHDKCHPQP
jgi:hypothetical protein